MATAAPSAPSTISPTSGQYDPDRYDICRPLAPPPADETDEQKIARLQQEFEALRDCVNAELKVRTESSLLTLILLKVLLPFAAIAAGFSAIYIGLVRAGESRTNHPELILGIGYLIIVAGAVGLWRAMRRPGSGGRGDAMDRSVRGALNLTVPPSKEKLTRNKKVNNWIFFWLTWGLIIGLPIIFFLFRANALDRMGLHLTFDTANVCAPTAAGFNPYEGQGVCDNSGYTYVPSSSASTGSTAGTGDDSGVDTLDIVPPKDVESVKAASVRIDVTTTLVLYFLIMVIGILVNMFRWWRRERQRKRWLVQQPSTEAPV